MTELVCVDGTVITLTADATWGWGTSTIGVTNFGNTKDVNISGTGTNLTVGGKAVILEADITSAMSSVTDSYHAGGTPGTGGGVYLNVSPLTTGTDGTLASVTITSGLTPSQILRHGTNGVILENLSGNFSISMTLAANWPVPPPPVGTPVPDVTLTRTGTWSIKSNGGNTKLKSN